MSGTPSDHTSRPAGARPPSNTTPPWPMAMRPVAPAASAPHKTARVTSPNQCQRLQPDPACVLFSGLWQASGHVIRTVVHRAHAAKAAPIDRPGYILTDPTTGRHPGSTATIEGETNQEPAAYLRIILSQNSGNLMCLGNSTADSVIKNQLQTSYGQWLDVEFYN